MWDEKRKNEMAQEILKNILPEKMIMINITNDDQYEQPPFSSDNRVLIQLSSKTLQKVDPYLALVFKQIQADIS